ncbi:serine hydrolase domain-containing protein [Cyclobacterium plantarum]|uniref:serine hydrolase domain-containing protein n=1 Tax=Cyclobacterium plantarum TaxID=2716263 RepID=UPI003F71F27C
MNRNTWYFLALTNLFVGINTSAQSVISDGNRSEATWNERNLSRFENKLETLRQTYHIPGFSVGVVHHGDLRWHQGFGFKDLESGEVPDENTVYHIASITKTFGALVMMKLVEEGKIELDDPVKIHDIKLPGKWGLSNDIKIEHLLTHTARGNMFNGYKPGYDFKYNGSWYHELGNAYVSATGKTFGELLISEVLLPLGMTDTAPSLYDSLAFSKTGFDSTVYSNKVAKPYDWFKKRLIPVAFNYNFGPAAGLMSTVADLAKYSIAIDHQKLLQEDSWQKILTPYATVKGNTTIYGLGWFVRDYYNTKFIWHTGWWRGYSSLLIKVPALDLTFIILANSQDVSRPFYNFLFGKSLHRTLLASDFANAFIEHFVFEDNESY